MTKASQKRDTSFERNLKRLEEIVQSLEQGEIALDDAIRLYEEGIQISKVCLDKLSQTEIKLKRLSKSVDANFELFNENLEE